MSTTKKKTKAPIDNYLGESANEAPKSENLALLDKYYGAAQMQLDEDRRLAQEKANVAYQTARKYLPIQNKMSGLAGLGVSESASIDAYNKYATRQGAIDSSYNTASADLLKNYTKDRIAENEKLETQKRAEQDALYNQAIETITGGYYTDWGDLENYLVNDVWGKVRPEQQSYLQQLYDYEMSNPTTIQLKEEERIAREGQQAEQTAAAENAEFRMLQEGKKLSVEYPNWYDRMRNPNEDIKITVNTGNGGHKFSNFDLGSVPDEIAQQLIQQNNILENQVFAHGRKLYIKKDGKFYEVTDGGSTTSQAYQTLINYFYPKN